MSFGQPSLAEAMLALSMLACIGLAATPAAAQNPPPVPPVFPATDANGVDLVGGFYNPPTRTVSIGPAGAGGLSYTQINYGQVFNNFGMVETTWTSNLDATISGTNAPTWIIQVGTFVDPFTCSGSGPYTCTSTAEDGSTLTTTDLSHFTYTNRAGDVFAFANGLLQTEHHASGQLDTYTYTSYTASGSTSYRLQSVTNNLGYQIQIQYASDTGGTSGWSQRTVITGINNAVDYCAPTALHCTGFTKSWPTLTLTWTGSPTTSLAIKDAVGNTTTYNQSNTGTLIGAISSVQLPSGMTISLTYNVSPTVASVSNGTGTWNYAFSTVGTTETTTVTDPNSHVRTVTSNTSTGRITSDENALNNTTSYGYDGFGRINSVTAPSGYEVQYTYDSEVAGTTRGNIVTTTYVPVSGSGTTGYSTSATFPSTCAFPVSCNEPTSTTDGNGKTTSYLYDNTYGVLTQIDPPKPTGSNQPETRFRYSPLYAYYKNSSGSIVAASSPVNLLTLASACQTEIPSACPGTVDEAKTTIAYGTTGVANNLQVTSVTQAAGNGSVTATNSFTYDVFGNLATSVGPLGSGQTTAYFYDGDRRPIGAIGPNPGGSEGLPYPAVRYFYTLDGIRSETDVGTDTSQTDNTFATFTLANKTVTAFDGIDRVTGVARKDNTGTIFNLSQYYYDNANRPTCSIVRMNSSSFSSLYSTPPPTCGLSTKGPNGNDRITQYTYDSADELTLATLALGDFAAQASYASQTFTNDGLVATVADANNNLTTYGYDGLDRLKQVNYPVTTKGAGTSDSTDYDAYTYDNNGNTLTMRRRSSDTITYSYDALNRVTEKQVPTWSGQNVFFGYDLLNRTTAADYGSLGGTGVAYGYDALGRITSETAGGRTLLSQYDPAGDRTQITWPDSFYVDYVYDNLQRPTKVEEEGATSGVGLLATYVYDGPGRLTAITRGNGANTSLGYDHIDRISTLAHSFANTSANVSWSFTYDAANGVLTRTATNDAYTSHPGALSLTYVANGLNQYSSVSGGTYSYDTRGNLTSDTARTFTYDVENKLLTGSAPTSATFTYDPLRRMQTDTASSATTTFLYDGANLSAEYNSSGTVLRRYVLSGLGTDEPLVWYEGSGTSSRRWLHADNQGSIVAYSDSSGDQDAAYGYSPYGEPGSWSTSASRYNYTGQLMIAENSLYNYKARAYDPKLGRFLQIDPIGYTSNANAYLYAYNNPLGLSDVYGLDGQIGAGCDSNNPCPIPGGTVCDAYGNCAGNSGQDPNAPGVQVTAGCQAGFNWCTTHLPSLLPGQLLNGPENVPGGPAPGLGCKVSPHINIDLSLSGTIFAGLVGASGGPGFGISIPSAAFHGDFRGTQGYVIGNGTVMGGVGAYAGIGPNVGFSITPGALPGGFSASSVPVIGGAGAAPFGGEIQASVGTWKGGLGDMSQGVSWAGFGGPRVGIGGYVAAGAKGTVIVASPASATGC